MCPKAIASLFYAISAHTGFHRDTLLSDSGGNLYWLLNSWLHHRLSFLASGHLTAILQSWYKDQMHHHVS